MLLVFVSVGLRFENADLVQEVHRLTARQSSSIRFALAAFTGLTVEMLRNLRRPADVGEIVPDHHLLRARLNMRAHLRGRGRVNHLLQPRGQHFYSYPHAPGIGLDAGRDGEEE
jgi:hypothetical protein